MVAQKLLKCGPTFIYGAIGFSLLITFGFHVMHAGWHLLPVLLLAAFLKIVALAVVMAGLLMVMAKFNFEKSVRLGTVAGSFIWSTFLFLLTILAGIVPNWALTVDIVLGHTNLAVGANLLGPILIWSALAFKAIYCLLPQLTFEQKITIAVAGGVLAYPAVVLSNLMQIWLLPIFGL